MILKDSQNCIPSEFKNRDDIPHYAHVYIKMYSKGMVPDEKRVLAVVETKLEKYHLGTSPFVEPILPGIPVY